MPLCCGISVQGYRGCIGCMETTRIGTELLGVVCFLLHLAIVGSSFLGMYFVILQSCFHQKQFPDHNQFSLKQRKYMKLKSVTLSIH